MTRAAQPGEKQLAQVQLERIGENIAYNLKNAAAAIDFSYETIRKNGYMKLWQDAGILAVLPGTSEVRVSAQGLATWFENLCREQAGG